MPGNRTFRWTLIAIVLGGLLIRVAWILAFHPVPMSDYLRYVMLARTLISRHIYAEDNFRACVPPGAAFFLAGAMAVVGDHWWTPALVSLVCYLASVLLIARLAYIVAGKTAALYAALAFSIWPSMIAFTGLAASEHAFIPLFILACFPLFVAESTALRLSPIFGIAAGLAALTRSVALLLPLVWLIGMWVRDNYKFTFWRDRGKVLALTSIFMLATVVPWTMRNYRVLHALIPVSTNGGSIFYRANNPWATGGWTPRGERDLDPNVYDEVTWNRLGYAWGREWIAAHPLKFARLILVKEFLFLRSDGAGVYWSIFRTYPQRIWSYRIANYACALWWAALGIAVAAALFRFRFDPRVICLLLPFLALFAVHSVYESHERYHMPAVPFLVILGSMLSLRRTNIATEWEPLETPVNRKIPPRNSSSAYPPAARGSILISDLLQLQGGRSRLPLQLKRLADWLCSGWLFSLIDQAGWRFAGA
jgi:4-amino-4-deoxy-L-arabinose transferase-like glycosyltransferase